MFEAAPIGRRGYGPKATYRQYHSSRRRRVQPGAPGRAFAAGSAPPWRL